mgnify:CR=1 FL=1
MDKKLNSKKASIYYLIGTLFNKGIGFITVPVFTRILTVNDYGIVTTYNSWVSIFMVIMSLSLYMSVRLCFVDYKGKEREFLSTILIFTIVYGGVIICVSSFLCILFNEYLNWIITMMCLIQALGSALLENISQYLMMKYKYKFRTFLMIFPNFISTLLAIILINFFCSSKLYLGRIIPTALITFGIAIILVVCFLIKNKIKYNREYVYYGLKISLPLVLHGIALNVLSQSDRTMISIIRNNSETGIYGLIYNFSMIATVITTAFEGIWVPFFIRKMDDKEYEKINIWGTKYIELMAIAMIFVILCGPEIVKMLATKTYWEGISIIPPIVLSNFLIFAYTLYVNVEHYYKKTVFISVNTIIAGLLNIILNFGFIDLWGYVGAAYSTFISYAVSLGLHFWYSRTLNKNVFPFKKFMLPMFLILCIVCLFYTFIEDTLIRWGIAIICCFIVIVKERVLILDILKVKKYE